jgi:peptidoglycan-associated lipoprotein
MKTSHRILRVSPCLLVVTACLSLIACGGKKRPPAVSGPGSDARTAPDSGAGTQPVEGGPDVRQLDADSARGEEFTLSDPETGEGGPLADIHFDYDQASLSPEAQSTLAGHAKWLAAHGGAKVRVEGHCDERGTVEYNLALGERRAQVTREYLVQLGVASGRLSIVTFGKERPLDPASNEAAWAKNRRAHFVVSR